MLVNMPVKWGWLPLLSRVMKVETYHETRWVTTSEKKRIKSLHKIDIHYTVAINKITINLKSEYVILVIIAIISLTFY